MAEVGIVITAQDKAAAVFAKLGGAGKASLASVRAGAEKAGAALKAVGIAGALLNQTLELAKKGMEMFRIAVTETVAKAFEFRGAMDPARKELGDFGNSLEVIRARLGDVLIPILQGVTRAMGPVRNSIAEWITQNRVLIGTNVVDWLEDLSNVLITGVAQGALLAAKAWHGWLMIINLVDGAVSSFFAFMLEAVNKQLGLFRNLASVFSDDLAAKIGEAQESVALLGQTFSDSGDQAFEKMGAAADQLDRVERSIKAGGEAARKFVGEAATEAYRALEVSIAGGTTKIGEQGKELEKVGATASQVATDWKATGSAMASTMGAAFGQIAAGSENAGKVMSNAVVTAAEKAINAAAASAAAQAAFSRAGIPVIGPVLAVAASSAMFAFVKGLLTKFDTGGVFKAPAGGAGVAMLHNKERVLTPQQTDSFDRLVRVLERNPRGGAGGGSVNLTIRSDTPPTDVDYEKAARRLARAQKRLQRYGMVGAT